MALLAPGDIVDTPVEAIHTTLFPDVIDASDYSIVPHSYLFDAFAEPQGCSNIVSRLSLSPFGHQGADTDHSSASSESTLSEDGYHGINTPSSPLDLTFSRAGLFSLGMSMPICDQFGVSQPFSCLEGLSGSPAWGGACSSSFPDSVSPWSFFSEPALLAAGASIFTSQLTFRLPEEAESNISAAFVQSRSPAMSPSPTLPPPKSKKHPCPFPQCRRVWKSAQALAYSPLHSTTFPLLAS